MAKKLGNQKKLEEYDPLYQEAQRKAKREFIGGHLFIFLILLLVVMVTVSMFSDAPLAQKVFETLDPEQQPRANQSALLTKLTGTLIGPSKELTQETKQGLQQSGLPPTTQLLEGVGYLLILIAIIVGLFTYASVSVRIEGEVDSRKVVINYIQLAKQQGFSKQQIRDRLAHEGHEMGDVEGLMSDAKDDGDDLQVSLKVN